MSTDPKKRSILLTVSQDLFESINTTTRSIRELDTWNSASRNEILGELIAWSLTLFRDQLVREEAHAEKRQPTKAGRPRSERVLSGNDLALRLKRLGLSKRSVGNAGGWGENFACFFRPETHYGHRPITADTLRRVEAAILLVQARSAATSPVSSKPPASSPGAPLVAFAVRERVIQAGSRPALSSVVFATEPPSFGSNKTAKFFAQRVPEWDQYGSPEAVPLTERLKYSEYHPCAYCQRDVTDRDPPEMVVQGERVFCGPEHMEEQWKIDESSKTKRANV